MTEKTADIFFKRLIVKITVLFCAFCFFSCANNAPEISSVEAKIVYDFESEDAKPVQKLSFFLNMNSDVRRVENINVYNEETGYRWIINNPQLIQNEGSRQYAGYTYLTAAVADNGLMPQGKYTVFYLDSCGKDSFGFFNVEYDRDDAKLTAKKLLEKKNFGRSSVMIAVYSKESDLLFFDAPFARLGESEDLAYKEEVEKNFPEAAYYRIFYKSENIIYIMPKIEVGQ